MIYLLFAGIALLSLCFVFGIGALKGVADPGKKWKLYRPCDGVSPFQGKSLVLLMTVCFVLALATQISLYKNTSPVGFVKLYGLFLIVFSAAIVDAKRKIIPNLLILVGLVFRAGIYVYEIFTVEEIKAVLWNDLIGLGIGFGFLALVSLLSRGALGFGDAKLFGVIGITAGAFCTYSTLLISLILAAVISVVCLLRKKMGRKDSIPFGPCIAAGYTIAVLLTSY